MAPFPSRDQVDWPLPAAVTDSVPTSLFCLAFFLLWPRALRKGQVSIKTTLKPEPDKAGLGGSQKPELVGI
eukprot:scaffold59741_cov12-Tisochrysis_lutea.AAC.2